MGEWREWKQTTESGARSRWRDRTNEDRALPFKDWHRTLAAKCTCQDIDLIEYRFEADGTIKWLAVLELTRADWEVTDERLHNILARISMRDAQGEVLEQLGRRLGCDSYIVVFTEAMKQFWIYDLMKPKYNWVKVSKSAMKRWIEGMGGSGNGSVSSVQETSQAGNGQQAEGAGSLAPQVRDPGQEG